MDDDPAKEGVDGLLEAPNRGAPPRQRGSGGSRSQERQQNKTRKVCMGSQIFGSPHVPGDSRNEARSALRRMYTAADLSRTTANQIRKA